MLVGGLQKAAVSIARQRRPYERFNRVPRRVISAARYRINAPILIFQMGKVGSTSVYRALREQALPVPVEHVHLLADLDDVERWVRRTYPYPSSTLRQIEHDRRLRQMIDTQPATRWNVITLVREPVIRNVSSFFESLHEFVPEARTGDVSVETLGHAFVQRFGHAAPLEWFQKQLVPVFGINPYAAPFPHDAGFQVLEGERARLLIMRTKDLATYFSSAIDAFLGVKIRRLRRANESEGKWYSAMQQRFLADFRFPPSYLDEMYGSEYARHFYTADELAGFRARFGER